MELRHLLQINNFGNQPSVSRMKLAKMPGLASYRIKTCSSRIVVEEVVEDGWS
jgi:hypothetical protein